MRTAIPLLLLFGAACPAAAPEDQLFFEKSVRPLLHKHCLNCHSREAKKSRGGLLLDSRAAVLAGGDSGPAVVPGQPAKSLLIQSVRYAHATLAMPPAGKLGAREVAVLEEWVTRGVPYPGPNQGTVARGGIDLAAGRKFWSFQPLSSAPPPAVRQGNWPRRRSDLYLLGAMEQRGLTPSPEADRRTLLRRVTFDLTGLPPSPGELEEFLADQRPDAYERAVERLLHSPAHGERWGRFWLDLVRYADVTEQWTPIKAPSYLYRDWVVRALNDDMPYDRFIEHQLAADLAGSPPEDRAALGLLGLSPTYWKELKLDHRAIQGVVAEEWEERIHTLGSTFLGLTVGCARCHDHKYDPVTMQDYYALAGVLASVREADVPVGPNRMAPGVIEESLLVEPDGPHKTKLTWKRGAQDVAMQVRGNPATLGPLVPRRFLAVLSPDPRPFKQGSGRLDLAKALVGEGGPLTARVMVNRIWRHHFGEGIVRTPSDFGAQGERPTHPELLDDLAARFVASGWSMRWLHREIVLSAAYRQTSKVADRADPENRWLARMPRRRLEVEAWRDAMVTASGTLRRQVGGPVVNLVNDTGERRTLYGEVKRRELADLLRLYDFPDPVTHSAARLATTTPLQQLFVLNGPLVRSQAHALAQRLRTDRADDPARIHWAYLLLYGRAPTSNEVQLGQQYLGQASWDEYAQVLLASHELHYVD
ncbi:MAG: PSD1 and planctomycete cytochrome C domain-containing protein [Gemmataceae bacterium]